MVENPGQASESKYPGAMSVNYYPFVVLVVYTVGYPAATFVEQEVGWPWKQVGVQLQ